MELWRKGTAGTTGVCLYQDPMVNLNSTADKTEDVYLAWKAQGTLDKGCSWIGGPTGSGKTLVAAWQCRR